jgi:hypothetical protein
MRRVMRVLQTARGWQAERDGRSKASALTMHGSLTLASAVAAHSEDWLRRVMSNISPPV